MKSKIEIFMLAIIIILLSGCGLDSPTISPPKHEPGEVIKVVDAYGSFYVFVPSNLQKTPEILVVIHGTPPKDKTAEWDALYYAQSWIDFADEHGYILIVPTFNQQDFSSRRGDHALGGYRGLFGRKIGADEWVIGIVDTYQQALGVIGEKFSIYGHSAGGQFTARFILTHPEMVKKAVITAAATYPQPTKDVAWPFGLGELETVIEWDSEVTQQVYIVPDQQAWIAANQIPLSVIVGLDDTAELPLALIPGQKGNDRVTIAKNWILDMAAFASANGVESQFDLDIIPGIGHSMSGLIKFSQQALLSD